MRKRVLKRRMAALESKVKRLERKMPKQGHAHDLHLQIDKLERRFRDVAQRIGNHS